MRYLVLAAALSAVVSPLSAQDPGSVAADSAITQDADAASGQGEAPPIISPAPAPVSRVVKESVADNGTYDVRLSPRFIIPPETPHERGARAMLKPGDIAFKASLGWMFHASTTRDVTAQISGIDLKIDQAETLRRAIAWGGGDLDRFPADTPVYCQRAKGNAVQNALSALTLGLTDLGTRVSKESQFCLMDANADGEFDYAFLEGLKRPEDRKAIAIDPVPYAAFDMGDSVGVDEGDYIQVRVAEAAGLFGRSIVTEVYVGGVAMNPSSLYWWTGPNGARLPSTISQKIPTKNHPQVMMFTNAALKVHGYDKKTKAVDVEYIRDFNYTPLTLVFTQYY